MTFTLKPLREQVIVITGASSGIGLATARMAATRGAKVVLTARNEAALRRLMEEVHRDGGIAAYVTADVGNEGDVRKVARVACERFGGIDTWVNNAGTSIYGKMVEVTTADHRRLFDTNFWGVVYGSLAAARHFRRRNEASGGAIINVGSALSDRAIPTQGMYSASKHAMKGFTDALRMELEAEGVPVSVTLVKPGAVDTPFPQHAKNYMAVEPSLPPPIYAPAVAAKAILHCAETPERDVVVGGGGKFISLAGHYAPRVTDAVMEMVGPRLQQTGRPAEQRRDALYAPTFGLCERGDYRGHVSESSLYTTASLHPLLTGLVVVGVGLTLTALSAQGTPRARNRPRLHND